jgi:hypothetical protein
VVAEVPLRHVHHPGCGPLQPPQLLAIEPSGEQPVPPGADGDAEHRDLGQLVHRHRRIPEGATGEQPYRIAESTSRCPSTRSRAVGSQRPRYTALPITAASYPATSPACAASRRSTMAPGTLRRSTSAISAAISAVDPCRVAHATRILVISHPHSGAQCVLLVGGAHGVGADQVTTTGQGANSTRPLLVEPSMLVAAAALRCPTTTVRASRA